MNKVLKMQDFSSLFEPCPAALDLFIGVQLANIEAAALVQITGRLLKNKVDIPDML